MRDDRHEEDGERNQHQRNAINAQRPGKAVLRPKPLDELPLGAADVVAGPQQQSQSKVDEGCNQRDPARAFRLHQQGDGSRDQRHCDEQRQQGQFVHQ